MINEKYSKKDFTDRSLLGVDPAELQGEIVGSCFYQQAGPDTPVFPCPVRLTRCNADNVLIPQGSVLGGCSARRLRTIDGVDWIVDSNNQPVEKL